MLDLAGDSRIHHTLTMDFVFDLGAFDVRIADLARLALFTRPMHLLYSYLEPGTKLSNVVREDFIRTKRDLDLIGQNVVPPSCLGAEWFVVSIEIFGIHKFPCRLGQDLRRQDILVGIGLPGT